VNDIRTPPDVEVLHVDEIRSDIEVVDALEAPEIEGLQTRPAPATTSGPPAGPDVDAIVVDIDDTLFLERDYVRSGFEAVGRWARRELRIDDFSQRAWAMFRRGHRGTIFDEVLEDCGVRADDAVVTEMVARYRTHTPSIALTADARAALDRWHGKAALAAVSDGPVSSQHAKARALGLDRWTPLVLCTAALGPGMAKPHPAAFEQVQEELAVEGKGCVYVADDPAKDFAGPKSLGWRTVRVRRRLGLHAEVPSGTDVDAEITSLNDLEAALAS
jgi:putative hydrolase of the HAD superfamily